MNVNIQEIDEILKILALILRLVFITYKYVHEFNQKFCSQLTYYLLQYTIRILISIFNYI